MNRYYLLPSGEKPPKLSLPQTKSPVERLHEDVNRLNQNPALSDEERWREYEKVFTTFLALTKPRQALPLATTVSEEGETLDKVLNTILPKSLRKKGLHLLQFIGASSPIQEGQYSISSSGELQVRGSNIPNSNIIDLINYAVRQRKVVPMPRGWPEFAILLRRINVPQELLAIRHRTGRKQPPIEPMEVEASPMISPKVLRSRKRPPPLPSPQEYKKKRYGQRGSGYRWTVFK